MLIFGEFSRHNLIKRYTNTHQMHHILKKPGELAYAPEHPLATLCNYS